MCLFEEESNDLGRIRLKQKKFETNFSIFFFRYRIFEKYTKPSPDSISKKSDILPHIISPLRENRQVIIDNLCLRVPFSQIL